MTAIVQRFPYAVPGILSPSPMARYSEPSGLTPTARSTSPSGLGIKSQEQHMGIAEQLQSSRPALAILTLAYRRTAFPGRPCPHLANGRPGKAVLRSYSPHLHLLRRKP